MKFLAMTLVPLFAAFALLFGSVAHSKEIVLTPDNTINFRGEVNGESVREATKKIMDLRAKSDKDLYIVFNSPGGSVFDGLEFIDFLKTQKNIHVVVMMAASMAAVITELNPGKRYITERGILMFHNMQLGQQGELNKVASRIEMLVKLQNYINGLIAKRAGISKEKMKEYASDELWLLGQEAVSRNFTDKIADLSCSKELIDSKEIVIQRSFFAGETKTVYSGCPLINIEVSE